MNVHNSIIHKSQKVETTNESTNEWINEMWYIHMMKYYPAVKKERDTDTCYNTDES